MFPFDNRVVLLSLSGAEVKELFRNQLQSGNWRAGIAGATVSAECAQGNLDVSLTLPDGRIVADDDRLTVVSNDFLATGGDRIFSPVTPENGFAFPSNTPLVRDQIVQWMLGRNEVIDPVEFTSPPGRFALAGDTPLSCG